MGITAQVTQNPYPIVVLRINFMINQGRIWYNVLVNHYIFRHIKTSKFAAKLLKAIFPSSIRISAILAPLLCVTKKCSKHKVKLIISIRKLMNLQNFRRIGFRQSHNGSMPTKHKIYSNWIRMNVRLAICL